MMISMGPCKWESGAFSSRSRTEFVAAPPPVTSTPRENGRTCKFYGQPRAGATVGGSPRYQRLNLSSWPDRNAFFRKGNHPRGRRLWLTSNPDAIRHRAGRRTQLVWYSLGRRSSGWNQPSGPSAAADELPHRREIPLRRWIT